MSQAQQLQQALNSFRILMEKKQKPEPKQDIYSKFDDVLGDDIFGSLLKKSDKNKATAYRCEAAK